MARPKLRVGVVDDNRSVGEIITEILGNRDFECFDAYDGRGAIEVARTRRLDLLILDLKLPDIDGLEVIRTLEGEGLHVPTLVITARAEDPAGGWKAHPTVRGVLRKPFSGGELRRAVAEITGRELP
ncbi:MAG TPA: response regulator [Candidatus Thermoplasmatota archaeon]